MPISAAAMNGIAANGHGWKHTGPRISGYGKEFGTFRDNPPSDVEEMTRFVAIVHAIEKEVSRWIASRQFPQALADQIPLDLEFGLEFMRDLSVCSTDEDPNDDIEEAVEIMNVLYDFCDYHRILIR
jgi:hypothetical protein